MSDLVIFCAGIFCIAVIFDLVVALIRYGWDRLSH